MWCMQSIGYRSIILRDGTAAAQMACSLGHSTLVVFSPIIGHTAFATADFRSPNQNQTCCKNTSEFAAVL